MSIQPVISCYRVYDVGQEINLTTAAQILTENVISSGIKLKKYKNEVIQNDIPLCLVLTPWTTKVGDRLFTIKAYVKLWNYGAISINLRYVANDSVPLPELANMVNLIEESDEVELFSKDKTLEVFEKIKKAIILPSVWHRYEDYTVIQFIMDESNSQLSSEFIKDELFYLLEPDNLKLSESYLKGMKSRVMQFSEYDFLIIDWNRALVLGQEEDVDDVSDILEMALCQLLELRYYDEALEKKLSELYGFIKEHKPSIWRNNFEKYSRDSALFYLEVQEVVDKVENSLKFIGDFYFANVYRSTIERFRLSDWKNNVKQKLTNMGELSKFYSSEINERRNQLMELIIVLLIAIEVIPFVFNLLRPSAQ